ncbi:G-protein coupled receptor daf-37 [Pseudolycoriella hygida]|uniref:G-protein coupled receptor daf-37 n=1 Tax=Pseudolycoriella hygida TaxID=35572 RepID=A0A9Q0MZT4_9DIPT|nr:G-protein coupled receptor daf-37 [Pseudolycoriella hygida]
MDKNIVKLVTRVVIQKEPKCGHGQFLLTSIITLLICIFGIIGNAFCCAVLFSRYMPRNSYIYLLQGLAISDICLLILSFVRTLDNVGIISLGQLYTGIALIVFFWDWISTSATKYFTVAVSIERFFAITFPFESYSFLTPKRSRGIALGILLFCTLLSCFSYTYDNWIHKQSFDIYVAILKNIRQQTESVRMASTSKSRKDEDNSVTKMLLCVVIVFGICYSFEFVRRVMNFAQKEYMMKYNYYDYIINTLADIFYVLNSSVNFIIYCVLGKSFRTVFFRVFNLAKFFAIDVSYSGDGAGENGTRIKSKASKSDYSNNSNSKNESKLTVMDNGLAVYKQCALDEI